MDKPKNEESFLHEILASPRDDDRRLVYADWLEEQGDPRCEYIRAECEFAQLADGQHSEIPPELRERIVALRSGLDKDWLAKISRSPVSFCLDSVTVQFDCPLRWHELGPTNQESVRWCEACRKRVFLCTTMEEGHWHANSGDCVCLVPEAESNVELRQTYLDSTLNQMREDVDEELGLMDFPEYPVPDDVSQRLQQRRDRSFNLHAVPAKPKTLMERIVGWLDW